jgi:general secretion pathway protein D
MKRCHNLEQSRHGAGFPPVTGVPAVLVSGLCILLATTSGCETRPQSTAAQTVHPAPPVDVQPKPLNSVPAADRITAGPQSKVGLPLPQPQPIAPMPRTREQLSLRDSGTSEHWLAKNEPAVPVPVPLTPPAPAEQNKPKPASEQQPYIVRAPATNMPALKPGMADELVSINFDNVDIRTVLKTVGGITGINFIPHESVTGPVTAMSSTPIRLGDIYTYLQSILDVHGYATIEMDNAVKVVPKAEAAKNHLQVRIGADPADIPRTDVIVTQIIPLKYADAAEMLQIIEPIVSTGAQVTTYPRTNSIMITDTSANIHHVAQVLQQLDVEGSKEKVLLFPLQHASAQVTSEQLTRILERNRTAGLTPGRPGGPQTPGNGPRVLPDERTNALIVIANEQEVQTVAALVRQIDVERPAGMNNVNVIYLKNADANEVARAIEETMANARLTGAAQSVQQVRVTADPSVNALLVAATPQDFKVIAEIAEKLDIVREQVLVETQIVEVTEESLQEIGVDWATLDDAVTDSVRGFGLTNLGPRVNFLGGRAEGLSAGVWELGSAGELKIGAILQALEKQSGVNILSTPHVLTSNHRKATIIVGENRPFVTASRITETTDPVNPTVIKSFEYKDVGITLEVTPHISQGGLIRLEIDSEFTKLLEDITTASLDTPTTAKRTIQTVVTMGSGATVVIGGLIRDDKVKTVNKVPLVGDLPLIGPLFQWQRNHVQKTNLLLFITPHIMSDQQDLQAMTEQKREEMAPALEGSR